MSVLLDALKKAAEEKKKQSQQVGNDAFGSAIHKESDSPNLNASKTALASKASKSGYIAAKSTLHVPSEAESAEVSQQDSTPDVDQIEASNTQQTSQEQSSELSLQLTPAETFPEREERILEDDVVDEPSIAQQASTPATVSDADFESADDALLESRQTADAKRLSRSALESRFEPAISAKDEEMLAKANENFAQSLLIQAAQRENKTDNNAEKTTGSKSEQQRDSNQESLSLISGQSSQAGVDTSNNSDLSQGDFQPSLREDFKDKSNAKDSPQTSLSPLAVDNAVPDSQDEAPTERNGAEGKEGNRTEQASRSALAQDIDDSYSWKMDELPGYQSLPEVAASAEDKPEKQKRRWKLNKKNAVLTKGENRKLYLSSSRLSQIFDSRLLYFSLFIGALAIIFIYGLFYYQEQSEALDQKFVKYRIERIETTLVAPKQEIADPLANKSQDAQQLKELQQTQQIDVNAKQAAQTVTPPEKGESVTALAQPQLAPSSKETVVEGNLASVLKSEEIVPPETKAKPSIKPDAKPVDSQSALEPIATSGEKPTEKMNEKPVKQAVKQAAPLAGPAASNPINPAPLPNEPAEQGEEVAEDASNANDAVVAMKKQMGLTSEARLLKDAYAAYELQNWTRAQANFQAVLELNPNNLKALLGLATSQLRQQLYPESVATYQQVLKLDSKNQYAYEGLVVVAGLSQQNAGLQEALSKVLEIYPNSAILQNAMGNLMAKQQQWQEAQSYYFNALAIEPNNSSFNLNLAVSLDHLRKFSLAKDYYQKALVLHDDGVQPPLPIAMIKRRIAALKIYLDQEGN